MFSISIYFYLTRQILITIIATLGITFLLDKKKHWSIIFLFIFATVILYFYWENLFGFFVKDYEETQHYTTDIRIECAEFVIPKILDNPLVAIVGHGHLPIERNSWYDMGYHLSDIGFIGESFYYGIVWVVGYFFVVYGIVMKHRKEIPLYIRLYVICTALPSFMIFPYHNEMGILTWACVLYICSLNIQSSKKKRIKYVLPQIFNHNTRL